MRSPCLVLLACIFVLMGAGCNSVRPESRANDLRSENFEMYAAHFENVVLVEIRDQQFETRPPRDKHRLYGTATVLRSYKGTWTPGETLRYFSVHEDLPSRPLLENFGARMFFFLAKHTDDLIFLDVGEAWSYETLYERVLIDKFSQKGR